MRKEDIKAKILTSWSRETHKNCKFEPGDKAKVAWGATDKQDARTGQTGKVYAVTCANDGKIRGHNTSYGRAYTRYYVDFGCNQIQYFESHHLING
jgi:hypothetical protein